jgi:hypothetical protein
MRLMLFTMNRIEITYNHETILVMSLTSRILSRTGRPVEIIKDNDAEKVINNGFNRFDWDEPITIKRQLLENWDDLAGEDIINRLKYLWSVQEAGVPKVDLKQTPELWLLKAVAQEKCLYTEIKEIEETYHHCRHLGRWNAVLIRNNLAVLKAKRQECLDSLSLLAEAIRLALDYKIHLKAPFYNAALIFQQLHQKGLLVATESNSRYVEILNEVATIIPSDKEKPESDEALDPKRVDTASLEHNVDDPARAYKSVARYGYKLQETQNFFQRNATYLAPHVDLFESFGDLADKVDTRTAHNLFERGIIYTDQERYAEGLCNFEIASLLDSAFRVEATMKTEQISDQWRHRENQRMADFLSTGDYDGAKSIILHLPDNRLKRDSDYTVVSSINKLQHQALSREAEELTLKGDASQAKLLYIALLKEQELDDSLRLHVSDKLAEPIRLLVDDAERHDALNELILYGAHPKLIKRLSDDFEGLLITRAIGYIQNKHYDLALEKYFWSLLLPDRDQRRDALMRLAIYAYDLLLKDKHNLLDDCECLQNPLFSEVKAELKERWEARQHSSVATVFERLDSEPWIAKKQIEELIGLLDQLISYAPTTERLVTKLRLPREKEAQQLFVSIFEQLEAIAKEGEHTKRREAIYGELSRLHDLAVDFAASERTPYARQITDFVLKAEEYLAQADTRKFMQKMEMADNERHAEEIMAFKETLKTNSDELQMLETICNTLRLMRGTTLRPQVEELSIYWLQHGKSRYQALAISNQDRARTIIEGSLEMLERNQQILPEEFNGEFKDFLQNLMHEMPKIEEQPNEGEQQSPPPPPPPLGFARRIIGWAKRRFNTGRETQ